MLVRVSEQSFFFSPNKTRDEPIDMLLNKCFEISNVNGHLKAPPPFANLSHDLEWTLVACLAFCKIGLSMRTGILPWEFQIVPREPESFDENSKSLHENWNPSEKRETETFYVNTNLSTGTWIILGQSETVDQKNRLIRIRTVQSESTCIT